MSHSLPRTTLESLKEVLAGYNKIADIGEKITDEEVAEARDVSENVAGRQKKFMVELGLLEKDGHDYLLTETGHEIGRLIRFNQEEEASVLLQGVLNAWEPTHEILSHISSGGIEKEDLKGKIALVTANELTTNRLETGASAVIDLLQWTGFIEQGDDGKYVDSEVHEQTPTGVQLEEDSAGQSASTAVEKPEPSPTPEETTVGRSKTRPLVQTTGANISLDISGDDDPENVRKLLLAIRRGSQENVDNYDILEERE